PIDPPSAESAVYLTTSELYATWYAARSKGDLYEVKPVGPTKRSEEDFFPTVTAAEAVVVRVVRCHVALTRSERRQISREWERAERRALAARAAAGGAS
ncbi:MAG: hypothetical protein Q8Q14_01720, partial [Gemmatimonadales bacterium]|nr:hypothetical protein [Gemmatimonadales bacterium]